MTTMRTSSQGVSTEQSLLQENQRLRERVNELDAFAQMISHDLRSPIATIHGFASLIRNYRNRLSNEEVDETLQLMMEETMRLHEMIDAILLFSRVSNLDQIEIKPLDMHKIIEDTQSNLMKMISQYSATIVMPDHWPVALGYAPWVAHVWMNYISNAIKYGGETPRVEIGAEAPADGQVRFWVRDNGAGLTREQQSAIFRPFIRLNGNSAQGHGLGLSIVARVVDKLGGKVSVRSTPNAGSTFYFSLPTA